MIKLKDMLDAMTAYDKVKIYNEPAEWQSETIPVYEARELPGIDKLRVEKLWVSCMGNIVLDVAEV